MKAGIFAFVIRIPFNNPIAHPATNAIRKAIVGFALLLYNVAASIPVVPKMDPTDRSISPEIIKNVIPTAMIPICTVCRITLIKFVGEMNTGLAIVRRIINANRTQITPSSRNDFNFSFMSFTFPVLQLYILF